MKYLEFNILTVLLVLMVAGTIVSQTIESLDAAYNYMKNGNITSANVIFEKYIENHPDDTKIFLQLAYNYKSIGNTDKAKTYFEYVVNNSKSENEITSAKSELKYFPEVKNWAFDVYSYTGYDSYQDNFIDNTIMRVGYNVVKNFYSGAYTDIYLDTKSKPGYI